MSARGRRQNRRRKEKFFIAQQGKCWLCGGQMTMDGDRTPTQATWDHVVPKSKGGSRSQSNLMLACRLCNLLRGNQTDVRAIEAQPA
jgi:5-methylcytosine-specific restriction endonuclease McrA